RAEFSPVHTSFGSLALISQLVPIRDIRVFDLPLSWKPFQATHYHYSTHENLTLWIFWCHDQQILCCLRQVLERARPRARKAPTGESGTPSHLHPHLQFRPFLRPRTAALRAQKGHIQIAPNGERRVFLVSKRDVNAIKTRWKPDRN